MKKLIHSLKQMTAKEIAVNTLLWSFAIAALAWTIYVEVMKPGRG
jgi:hypothetical protein